MSEMANHWNMRKIDQIPMRITHVGFHPAKTKNNIAISFACKIFSSIQRFIQRNAKPAFEQHWKFSLATDFFK
jgi:hypothetical protein